MNGYLWFFGNELWCYVHILLLFGVINDQMTEIIGDGFLMAYSADYFILCL